MRLIWRKDVTSSELLLDTLANAFNALEADILKDLIKSVSDLEAHRIKLAYFCTLLPYRQIDGEKVSSLTTYHVNMANLLAKHYCRYDRCHM